MKKVKAEYDSLENKLHPINKELYKEFRRKYDLPRWLSRSLVKTERKFRKKGEIGRLNYYSKLTAAGIAIGAFPRDIQEVLGRSIGVPKEDVHLLTALKSIPEPAEIVLAGAMISSANNGGIPEYQLITAGIIIADKIIYTALPLITKKNYLRPLSIFTNPIVGTTAVLIGGKKIYNWIEPRIRTIQEEFQDTRNYLQSLPKVATKEERDIFKQDISRVVLEYKHSAKRTWKEIVTSTTIIGNYTTDYLKIFRIANKPNEQQE